MAIGSLLTQYYLREGIRDTAAYKALSATQVTEHRSRLLLLWQAFRKMQTPSEADTESEFIYPVLQQLGWEWLVQPKADKGRRDIPDALLFNTLVAKQAAQPLAATQRFHHGAVVVENEAARTNLDRSGASGEAPASQILRYMARAETLSDGKLRWGLLTNGRTWRLYDVRATSRAEGFVSLELADIVDPPPLAPLAVPAGAPPDHWMRVFLLLFGRDAFVPEGPAGSTLIEDAIASGRTYRARITETLSARLFDEVYPTLIQALGTHDPAAVPTDPAWRASVQEGAIRLLYRLLFLFYAEDRALLPVHNPAYRDYSLQRLRAEAAKLLDQGNTLSKGAFHRWSQMTDVFTAIADGSPDLQLPAYNGSLFRNLPNDILARIRLPDAVLVPLVDAMSRTPGPAGERNWINYRDLSVQHLGSIYERLLEHDVILAPLGRLSLRPSPYARKNTGSYYTREELVSLILRQSVMPLIEERKALALTLAAPAGAEPPADAADAILHLRVCDAAMGSGHFLVSLVDLLTDQILTAMADAAAAHPQHGSPVSGRIRIIRERILANAEQQGWTIPPEQLDDRHIVRRMVLKRCVFGVDLNPMAVELAKLSLWLHSFTVGAPLSFLDHHLRCGDSLFGEFVGDAVRQLQSEFGLAITPAVHAAQAAAARMADIEELADVDIAEVHESLDRFVQLEQATLPLRSFLDLYHAARWIPAQTDTDKMARKGLFGGAYGDPVAIMQGAPARRPNTETTDLRKPTAKRPGITAMEAFVAAQTFVTRARQLSAARRFLHWQAAFPGVWSNWLAETPDGGFDAVIGNPPWDRIKMQEVEWWAARDPDIARLSRASDRKRAIATRRAAADPLAADYDAAADHAKRAAEVAAFLPKLRRDGSSQGPYPLYPLFAKGDVNLYALFVERAGQIVAATGIVGLLVPSGVAADKGAADFFRSISNTGRLGALLDFENRRPRLNLEPFFPGVDSRFKFSALIHGGTARHFAEARCAFFQQDAAEAEANAFPLTPTDFALVNPNTGTAPVFRSREDAAIVLGIYRRCPVLLDRRTAPPTALFPVSYMTQFHMTNDSAKFRTAEELDADGAYPVQGGAYEKGNIRYLPLMSGRSIHLFDHRYAAVVETDAEDAAELNDADEDGAARLATRSRNLNRPFSTQVTSSEQHADIHFIPHARHWVSLEEFDTRWPAQIDWGIAFRDITSPTNARTAITAIVPRVAFTNALPVLLPTVASLTPDRAQKTKRELALLVGNLCSLILDFVCRAKMQSVHLNAYLLEQLPLIPPSQYARRFGPKSAEDIVRDDVLHLTYTAHNLADFARDQGYHGPPFVWDEDDRLRRRARLDAVFMLLYGIDRSTAGTIIDTFPIVARQENDRYGRFRTRDLVLRTMAALEAGNPDAAIAG